MAKEVLVQGAQGLRGSAKEALRHAPHVHLGGTQQRSQNPVACGVLRDFRGDDRQALWAVRQERFTRAFTARFRAKNRNLLRNPTRWTDDTTGKVVENLGGSEWSGRVDLNHRLHGPEPCALPS